MKPRIPHPLRDPPSNLCDIIRYGYFHQLRLLICSGVTFECRDACRRTPIMLCAFMEPETWGVGTARTLIENGARLDRKDKSGRNVLHYACIYERFGLIHVLFKAIDFDLNQPDKIGNTVLHYAALSGNVALTQLISRFFQRYKINPEKTNKHGRTAVQEAYRVGNTACARIIEHGRNGIACGTIVKELSFDVKELHFDQLVGTANGTSQCPPVSSNGTHLSADLRRSSIRPSSATFLTRRDSSVSLASLDERRSSLSYRSRSIHSRRGSHRNVQSPLLVMGIKREEEVIPCADEKDFRNTPDFVFKLLHLHFDLQEWNPMQNLDSSNRNNAWGETGSTCQSQTVAIGSNLDWRQELKSLFKVYESQCSSSWRAAPKAPSSNPPEEQERTETEEEERGKKSRRHSNHSRPGAAGKEQAGPDLRRRPSTTRIVRRLSSVHGPIGKIPVLGALDGNLNTSSESINSSVSSFKKRGPEKEMNPTGRSESISNRAGIRRPSLEPSCPSSPCTSPLPPPILASDQKQVPKPPRRQQEKANNRSKTTDYIADNGLASLPYQAPMNNERSKYSRRSSQDSETSERSRVNFKDKVMAANVKLSAPNGPAGFSKSNTMTIPRVRECLVKEAQCSNIEVATKVDTSRLWVQNPYDDNEEYLSDDYDDEDDDVVA